MAFRITDKTRTNQRITDIPISAVGSTAFECNPNNPLTNVSFCCWYYCEHDNSNGNFTIWETAVNSTTPHFCFYFTCNNSTYTFKVAGYGRTDLGLRSTYQHSEIVNRWIAVVFNFNVVLGKSYFNVYAINPDKPNGDGAGFFLTNPGVTNTNSSSGYSSPGKPTFATIGSRTLSSNNNAKGICIPSISTNTFFRDGIPVFLSSITGESTTDVIDTKRIYHNLASFISFNEFDGLGITNNTLYNATDGITFNNSITGFCQWAANYAACGITGSTQRDSRINTTLSSTGANFIVFDRGATSQPNSHLTVRGCAAVGTIISVNPFEYGTEVYISSQPFAGAAPTLGMTYPSYQTQTLNKDFKFYTNEESSTQDLITNDVNYSVGLYIQGITFSDNPFGVTSVESVGVTGASAYYFTDYSSNTPVFYGMFDKIFVTSKNYIDETTGDVVDIDATALTSSATFDFALPVQDGYGLTSIGSTGYVSLSATGANKYYFSENYGLKRIASVEAVGITSNIPKNNDYVFVNSPTIYSDPNNPSDKINQLADWLYSATGNSQLRVGIQGSSRAVSPRRQILRFVDGQIPAFNATTSTRTTMNNFCDSGIVGQKNLWNDGKIVGAFIPIPTCMWSVATNGEFAGATALEGAYGPNCSVGLLQLTLSGGSVTSNLSLGLKSMANTTLGTRFCETSRVTTPVANFANDHDNYRGNGCAVRLLPGCKYRIMIFPETGLPTTEDLMIKLHLINHPSSSSVAILNKVTSSNQNGTSTSTVRVDTTTYPTLGSNSNFRPPSLKTITDVRLPELTSQYEQNILGRITFDDSATQLPSIFSEGDLVQIYDSNGTPTNDAMIAQEIDGQGTNSCTVTYDWTTERRIDVGDKLTFIRSGEIYKSVSVEFSGSSGVGSGTLRGIEIQSSNDGDGLLLWGLEFVNTQRSGIVFAPIGRPNCGTKQQVSRYSNVRDSEDLTVTERMFDIMNLDVIVMTTADEDIANENFIDSFEDSISKIRNASGSEIVVYSTGPEYEDNNVLNKEDYNDMYSKTAAMQLICTKNQIPHTAYIFSRNITAFGRIMTGDDVTESPKNPSTVLDIKFLGEQLKNING